MATIRFFRKPVEVSSVRGNTLLRAAHKAGLIIKHPCGGKGICGACVVRVRSGTLNAPAPEEIAYLGAEKITEGYRLACLAEADGDVEIELI